MLLVSAGTAKILPSDFGRDATPFACPSSLCAHKPTPPDVGFIGLSQISERKDSLPPLTKKCGRSWGSVSQFKNWASAQRAIRVNSSRRKKKPQITERI